MSEKRSDPFSLEGPGGGYTLDERRTVKDLKLSPEKQAELERLKGMTYEEILADLAAKPVTPRPKK
jgi:hypothetical protein